MKLIIGLLSMVLLFSACNNKSKDQPVIITGNDAFEKALQDDIKKFPDSLILVEKLIQHYRDSGDYEMAIAVTDNAIKKDSENVRLWNIKATLHVEDLDTLSAIKAMEKAVAVLPDPGYLSSLGILYAETKNSKALIIADAIKGKQGIAEGEPLFIKGLYFAYSGEKQKAIAFFDQCLGINYTDMNAYREKAIALYDLGKYEEALKVLDKATLLQNVFDEGYYWMGRCNEKLNRIPEAIEDYQLAVKTAKSNNDENIDAMIALERLGAK